AQAKLEHELQRAPTEAELASKLNMTEEELQGALLEIANSSVYALDEPWADEVGTRLTEAVGSLPEREQLVVALYYYENLTLREIGEVLGVTESRASGLHTRAVMRLKSSLSPSASGSGGAGFAVLPGVPELPSPDEMTEPPLRYLRVRAPSAASPGPFAVQARIDLEAAGASSPLMPFDVPPEGLDVILVLNCQSLAVAGPSQFTVHLPPDGPSNWALFELSGAREGIHEVTVIAFVGGTSVGDLTVQITIDSGARQSKMADRRQEIESWESAPGDVSLLVRYDPEKAVYRFQLFDSEEPDEERDSHRLARTPKEAVEGLIEQLNATVRGRGRFGPVETREWLRQKGIGLWDSFIPEALQSLFWERRDRIGSLTVMSADDLVPWELLYPLSNTRDEGFLAEQFPVLRWTFRGRRGPLLPREPVAFVLPDRSPPQAAAEIASVGKALNATPQQPVHDLAGLNALLRASEFGVLHFACHNTFRPDQPDTTEIDLSGGPFQPTFLNELAKTKALERNRPLIFMNACSAASSAPHYTQLLGWASQFVAAGSSAFVGPLWEVRDSSASTFAEAFYDSLFRQGVTLGEALQAARAAIREVPGDPTWLAYAVYGQPGARMV
ncbi:MAG TPA: sigma-70 family RNA polymerase sigma factor, partial [Solirubrobacterales bacterium]|nr:sigma-70 family RNA polymerase sigma factor [Solirubrobacterales bacterium]